jgi:Gluconate 2-dehydrogenase subunit 3
MIPRRALLRAVSGLVAALLAGARAFSRRAAAATPKGETFSQDEARVVAAIAERIWPGAAAAGTVTYIDHALAHAYRPEARVYRAALPQIDAASRRRFATHFVSARGEQQDALLADLEAGRLEELPGAHGAAIFNLMRRHVMEGVLADPIYGGNRDFAGWKAVGYPGPYRIHSEQDQTRATPLEMPYQGIKDL